MPTLHFQRALLPAGWAEDVRLTLDGGRITAVETGVAAEGADERHAIALPPVANLHSHAFQRAMAGLAERRGPTDDTFWTWRETMYRIALAVSPEAVEAVAAMLYVEMLEAGFGRVGEFHYLHHDRDGTPYGDVGEMANRIAAAAGETGIGLTLLPVFYAHATFGGAPPKPGQRRFISDPDLFARLVEGAQDAVAGLDRANVGIAPHSLRAATPAEIRAILPLAASGPIHIHAAEQVLEVEDSLAALGQRPGDFLLDAIGLDGRWCLIHATHMTPGEAARLGASGAVAGLCPITEANLGDGIFDGPGFAGAGGRYGVGSDSNVLIGLAEELRQFETAQRLGRRQRNVMATGAGASTGRSLFDAVLAGGHAALGQRAPGLAAGAPADILTLDADNLALAGRQGDGILDGWIFATRGPAVDSVWIGGRKLVAGGRHVRRAAVERRFRSAIAALAEA